MKKILITGSAGFIGFHIAQLLLNEGNEIIGVDNLSDYYDVNLKKIRNKILLSNKNFTFEKLDISKLSKIKKIICSFKPDYIIHLAAQAGIRYSIKDPTVYLQSNIIGTFNILECLKDNPVKHFLFSSTSSIYGSNESMPYKETDKSDTQLSFYAASKKSCESMIHTYSHLYKIPSTCFRFFTVYGPFGRPDMAYFKFTKSIINNEIISVNNNGHMKRDFTYIDDLTKSIRLLMLKKPKKLKLAIKIVCLTLLHFEL